MMVYLGVGGKEIPATVLNESSFLSRHTGKELKSLQVEVVALDELANEQLLKILEAGKHEGISSLDGSGTVLSKWKVKNDSYSYSTGRSDSGYVHNIEMEELESLEMTKLLLDELELEPYFYVEEFDSDALIVNAKVFLSDSQYSVLKKIMKSGGYFPVIRQGISSEPKQMRFGITRWSKHENGIKHELLLIEKNYDEANKNMKGMFEPQMPNMQAMLAEDTELVEALIGTLLGKGLLDTEDVNEMRSRVSERFWDRNKEFYKVKDIDMI